MSNHKTPLTELERKGLEAHGLGRYIGKPSQLADAFRAGVAWAVATTPPAAQRQWVGLVDTDIGDEYVRFEIQGGFNRFEYAVRAIEAKLKEKNT